eukprot:gene23626-28310_t
MSVTHTDGFPVVPTEVDALLLGMGERYDVIVTVKDGVFPLVAAAEGKNAQARTLLRTGSGAAPDASFLPRELAGRPKVSFCREAMAPVSISWQTSGGDMMSYQWTINGRNYDQTEPLTVKEGDRARLTFTNMTMMWHPMHLHGHTFQVVKGDGGVGP